MNKGAAIWQVTKEVAAALPVVWLLEGVQSDPTKMLNEAAPKAAVSSCGVQHAFWRHTTCQGRKTETSFQRLLGQEAQLFFIQA